MVTRLSMTPYPVVSIALSHARSSYRRVSRRSVLYYAAARSSLPSTAIFAHRLHIMAAQPVTLTIPATGRKITVPTGLFINNEFVPSVDSTETIQYVPFNWRTSHMDPSHLRDLRRHMCAEICGYRCINPATEEAICSIVAGTCRRSRSSPIWLGLLRRLRP